MGLFYVKGQFTVARARQNKFQEALRQLQSDYLISCVDIDDVGKQITVVIKDTKVDDSAQQELITALHKLAREYQVWTADIFRYVIIDSNGRKECVFGPDAECIAAHAKVLDDQLHSAANELAEVQVLEGMKADGSMVARTIRSFELDDNERDNIQFTLR